MTERRAAYTTEPTVKFASLFSGIGGFDLGLERAGMTCSWQCEIDKDARKVLASHWPTIPCYEDVRNVGKGREPVDLICGGFPCQDLSVAGKRAGLAGSRSGLWFEFARIIDELEPGWVVIENVPGLLSSNRGRDFAVIVQWLANRGYGVAWRVLDSQYFGVAQRRRRVFIVASFGNGRAAEVLFEREGMSRDSTPRRKAGEEVSPTLAGVSNGGGASGPGRDVDSATSLVIAHGQANAEIVNDGEPSLTLNHEQPIVWQNRQQSGEIMVQDGTIPTMSKFMGTGGNNVPLVGVRRLTPTECERLQGFPDGWTAGQSDSARYRQLGNAVTVNVIEWIGRRIVVAK